MFNQLFLLIKVQYLCLLLFEGNLLGSNFESFCERLGDQDAKNLYNVIWDQSLQISTSQGEGGGGGLLLPKI